MTIQSKTKVESYNWMAELPSVREWIGERHLQNMSSYKYIIENRDFESTISVNKNDLDDDRLGMYKIQLERLAESASRFPDELVFETLEKGFENKCFDNEVFFSDKHKAGQLTFSNKTSKKLTAESYQSARATMMSFKNEQGRSLNIRPNLLVVPPNLESIARQILKAEMIDGTTNIYKDTAEILTSPYLISDKSWYLLDTTKSVKPILFQEREKPKLEEDENNVFNKKQILYGVSMRCNTGYGFWQMAYGSTGTTV